LISFYIARVVRSNRAISGTSRAGKFAKIPTAMRDMTSERFRFENTSAIQPVEG
jgi:hypothetical protein